MVEVGPAVTDRRRPTVVRTIPAARIVPASVPKAPSGAPVFGSNPLPCSPAAGCAATLTSVAVDRPA
jgi:hypothetical protein